MLLSEWHYLKCCSSCCIASTSKTGGLASQLPGILGITDISDFMHPFGHDKSSSTSQ